MGFIDIDDRDVFNYYGNSLNIKEKLKEWLVLLKAENKTAIVVNLGDARYKIDIPMISCTGGNVEDLFMIPSMHELLKIELKHVDASNIDSQDNLEYKLERRTSSNLWIILYKEPKVIKSDIIDEYIGFYHERSQYKFTTNTTNTDRLYVSIYVRITGE